MRLRIQIGLFLILCFHLQGGGVHCVNHSFVLVHGHGGGGWGFYKIKTLLDSAGHNTSSPDLRSGGIDPTPAKSIKTFDQYNEPLIHLLSCIPDDQQVILVGHSSGGVSLTDAIHKFPKKIKAAVFISATMLRRGYLTEDDKRIEGVPGKNNHGHNELLDTGITCGTCNKSSPEDHTLGNLLRKPHIVPKEVITKAKFPESPGIDQVKRVYIRTTHDEVWFQWQQKKMIEKWPPSDVFCLASDHNVPVSDPLGVYDLLVRVAEMK